MRPGIAALAVTLALVPPALADVVYFESGETLKGLVVEEHRDRVVVSTEGGERTILRGEVDEIFYSEPERNYLYLGRQAMEQGEFSLARGFLRKALQIHPRLSEAEDALHRLEDLQRRVEAVGRRPAGWAAALEGQLGLALSVSDSLPVVASVRTGSAAEQAGLRAGDALAFCWGFSLAFLAPEQAAEELVGEPGTGVKITLQRQVDLPAGDGRGRRWPQAELEMERLGLTVRSVGTGGVAEKAGLSAGDRIIRIGEEPTRYMPLAAARDRLAQARGKGIRLILHRDRMLERQSHGL